MIELQYGDKTFPSFVKWLLGWKVETPKMMLKIPFNHIRKKEQFLYLQEVHKDLCPDPDEDTPVACDMNPHWNQLQERLLSHATVRAVLLLLGFFL